MTPILVAHRHSISQPNKTYGLNDKLSLHFHSYIFPSLEVSSTIQLSLQIHFDKELDLDWTVSCKYMDDVVWYYHIVEVPIGHLLFELVYRYHQDQMCFFFHYFQEDPKSILRNYSSQRVGYTSNLQMRAYEV